MFGTVAVPKAPPEPANEEEAPPARDEEREEEPPIGLPRSIFAAAVDACSDAGARGSVETRI